MQKVKKWFTKLKVICLVCVAVFIALFALVGVMGRATNKIVITGDAEVMEYIETLAYYYTNYVNTDISIDVNAPGSFLPIRCLRRKRSCSSSTTISPPTSLGR